MFDQKFRWAGRGLLWSGLVLTVPCVATAASSVTQTINDTGNSDHFSNPEEDTMNRQALNHPRFGQLFKVFADNFPTEYEEFIRKLSKNYTFDTGFDFMQELKPSQRANIARAPNPNLSALIEVQFRFASRLSQVDQGQCAHFTMKGGFRPTDRFSTDMDALMIENATLWIKAAAAGRDTPVKAPPPSDQDWLALLDAMPTLTEIELNSLITETTDQLPETQECKIGLGIYSGLVKMDRDAAIRIYRSL